MPDHVMISRSLNRKGRDAALRSKLLRIEAADDFILDAEKIAIGAYSPLSGFMCREDFAEVVHKMRLKDGSVWTIPIFLPVHADIAGSISKGDHVIIRDLRGHDIALMVIKDIFSFPKDEWARNVYRTESRKHPGVKRLYDMHDKLLGGDIYMINRPRFKFEAYNIDPLDTRKIIRERGWKTVAGFQTRNVPHRAHEYLQKIALSLTDGILIHPIIGWKRAGDFGPEAVLSGYKALIRFYYPKGRVIFAGLTTAMRYAGPREAVFHAIIRRNYGCTHFIIGRDHAGVGDYYGKYDAHRIFDDLPDLGITPLLLREPYYCRKCAEIVSDKVCPHSEKFRVYISGTLIRRMVQAKKDIPPYMMRREVVNALERVNSKNFISAE